MAATPLLLGLRWLSMEFSLSVAMITGVESVEDRQSAVYSGEELNRHK